MFLSIAPLIIIGIFLNGSFLLLRSLHCYFEQSVTAVANVGYTLWNTINHAMYYAVYMDPRSFAVSGKTLRNSLTVELKGTHIPLEYFKLKLKTYLFTKAYDQ